VDTHTHRRSPEPSPSTEMRFSAAPLSRTKKLLFSTILFLFVVVPLLEFGSVFYLKAFRGYDGKQFLQYEFDSYKNILPARDFVDTRGIRHNSQGFRRSSDVSREKPAGTFRIFLMGGSTAYGLGGLWPHIQREFAVLKNSETIDSYLETDLSQMFPGTKIEVINAAITSTWTHHHLIYLNQTILRYMPDMIIFIDGRNDYYEFDPSHDQFDSYARGEHAYEIMGPPTAASLAHTNVFWLYRKSAFAYLFLRAARDAKRSLTNTSNRRPLDVNRTLADMESVFTQNALKMNERIAVLLKHENVSAVFVLQPMLILERARTKMPEVERQMFEFVLTANRPHFEDFMHKAVRMARDHMERAIRKHNALFLDATGIYTDARAQVFTDYCHLTPYGNEVMAAFLAEQIRPTIERRLKADD
jgi:hypothetical protein